jgi:CBS domain-containing protein/sporulation protein YlmC with PRC-barrel domain
MLYFSEIRGKKVSTEDGIQVGHLDDFIFLSSDKPRVTKLVIRNAKNEALVVPIDFLKKTNGNFIIAKSYLMAELQDNELYVLKNLLDKQIIDIKGNKIVRVNDIAFQREGTNWYIVGVDIGLLGVLRWFRLHEPASKFLRLFGSSGSSRFLSWSDIQPVELSRGQVKLKKEETKLERLRPEDLADHLEKTNLVNTRRVLRLVDENFAAQVISDLNIDYQIDIIRHFRPEKSASIINLMDPDEAVDILLTLSKKRREGIINLVSEKKRLELFHLMSLSKTPIGSLMTTEFISVPSSFTVKETINKIKKESVDYNFLNYVYVVNEKNQLVGVFNLHELILQNLDEQVYKFMTQNVISVYLTSPEEIALKKILKYELQALPIINEKKNILGILSFDVLAAFISEKIK